MSGRDDAIEFRILGPFEASEHGRSIEVGAGKQRALLVLLLLAGGEVVSTDRLIDGLWGERPPASALNSVHVYVSQLRKALGDGRLQTRGRGYRLALGPEQFDLGRFERLSAEGRDLLASGETERAAQVLCEALGLWRGPPLSDLASEPFASGEIDHLDELRLAALEERIEADLARGRHAELVPELQTLVRDHPLRERLCAQLMLALYRSGRQSGALDAYQQARRMLAEELGLAPGRTLQELEAAVLRQDAALDPPGQAATPAGPPRRRRRVLIAAAAALLMAAVAVVAFVLLGGGSLRPVAVLPNSLVRIDPSTLKPTQVVPGVGDAPDLVVEAGGFLWITNDTLRDTSSGALRNAGDRTLTRVDPATGDTVVVGGGLAPCGLTADPSGDVWVASCYPTGRHDDVIRVDAQSLAFKKTWLLPGAETFFRGLAYVGGSLWASDPAGAGSIPDNVTQIDPQRGSQRTIHLARQASWLESSEGYGDLWITNFNDGSVMRLHAASGAVETFDGVAINPADAVVDGDVVWFGDWAGPRLARLSAVGSSTPHSILLPAHNRDAGVWDIAAGVGYIWATTPRDHALWRINPKTNAVRRIAMPYLPTGVTADGHDIWVTVRKT